MIGTPLLIVGLLLIASALVGARVAGPGRGAASFVLAPLHPSTWGALAAILVGTVVEILVFSTVVTLFSAGSSILVIGVGFVLVAVGIEIARAFARYERRRMAWFDPRPLVPHTYRSTHGGLREAALGLFFDLNRWRDVLYVLVALPLLMLEAIAVMLLWTLAVAALTIPFLVAARADLFLGSIDLPGAVALPAAVPSWPVAAGFLLAGLVLTPVAAVVTQGLARLHRAVVAGLLCVSGEQALVARVETLESSRRRVLDVEASELRRIERDLHDGAQQRLVMLTINLSLAADRIDTDPAAAKSLVIDAREQARTALAELRDLVRGIAPSILVDRGLVPALAALAGRAPIPTVVASTLPEGGRLSEAVERAAYFVVAEALANQAKHAKATRGEVRCGLAEDGRTLLVEVHDDGVGGAVASAGGGLAGLASRVEALDGTLEVSSPSGGPTVVRARIPLAMSDAAWPWSGGTAPGAPARDASGAGAPAPEPPVPGAPHDGDQDPR